jgi:putative hydroxymethylpyrimidine transport system substrate-binding protein
MVNYERTASMSKHVTRLTAVALACALLAATIAACGEKSEDTNGSPTAEQLDLVLDWFPNPDHVAIYNAIDRGFYDQVGLKVQPQVPSDPSAPIKQVAAGRADLAISYEPELFLARQQGLPVTAVAAVVQKPLTSFMATAKQGVKTPAQLKGKRVGTAGIPYQSAYLKTILDEANVPEDSVKETNVGTNLLPAMLSSKVDATLGGFWNVEGIQLKQRGAKPVITPVNELGVPDYDELVLVANSDRLEDNKNDLRLFISATARGADSARKNPAKAAAAVRKANRDLSPKLLDASVKATIPALFPEKDGAPWGYIDLAKWRSYGAWMRQNGLISDPPDVQATATNELLPGEGL